MANNVGLKLIKKVKKMKIGNQIIKINSIDSTNNYAQELIKSKNTDANGTVIIADYQSAGRGQVENKWESENGKNLLISIVLYPQNLEAINQFILSKFVCLSIINYLKNKNITAQIKWPNDIYVNNKKIAGILIENSIQGNLIKHSIIGIGLNINQINFSETLKNPISLANILNIQSNLSLELDFLLKEFNILNEKLQILDFKYFDKMFLNNLYKLNIISNFKNETEIFEAKIIGITNFGQLLLERKNKSREIYNFKEIEFLF